MSEREQTIKEYEEFSKKYGLPKLEELEEEFEIKLQPPFLGQLLSLLYERFMYGAGHIEKVMYPQSPYDMFESRFHTDEQKKPLFAFYQQLMSKMHTITHTVYKKREDRVKCCKEMLTFYHQTFAPFMAKFVAEHAKKWSEIETKEEKKESYMG